MAPLAAQCYLKVLAWRDRRHATPKDALDLYALLRGAGDEPYADDLYADEQAFEAVDHDPQLAAAYRTGQQAVAILRPDGASIAAEVLLEHGEDMARDSHGTEATELFDAFRKGLLSPRPLGLRP